MRIAYILFDSVTMLDFIGMYDPISRLKSMKFLPDLEWDICTFSGNIVDSFGLEIPATKSGNDLGSYDAIIVPGGFGTRTLMKDEDFINWLRTAAPVPWKVSVCSGSLLLGAAGFLEGRKATTNLLEAETLQQFCKEVSSERVVEDNGVVTGGAVAASLDVGLYMCNTWVGPDAEAVIRSRMNYH
jgi:transcriptional regulator GlxA family with amidase domain